MKNIDPERLKRQQEVAELLSWSPEAKFFTNEEKLQIAENVAKIKGANFRWTDVDIAMGLRSHEERRRW